MNNCIQTLAQTGSSGFGPMIAIAVLLFVGGLVFLVLNRRKRKEQRSRGLQTVGLIVLLGLGLSATGALNAAPSSAAEASTTTSSTRCPAPRATVVTPAAPVLLPAAVCGVESTVRIVPTKGVDYARSRTGNTISVTATAQTGNVIASGAQTSWSFDVTPTPCPCVPTVSIAPPSNTTILAVAVTQLEYTLNVDSSQQWFSDLQAGGGTWSATGIATITGMVQGLDAAGDPIPQVEPVPWSVVRDGGVPLSFDLQPTIDATIQQLEADHPEVVQTTFFIDSAAFAGNVTATYSDGCQQQTLTFDIAPGGGGGGNN